jgi:HK97 family phage portal protein
VPEANRYIPNSLNAKGKPSWPIRAFRKLATRIDPEIFTQEQGVTFSRYGLSKSVGGKFADISTEYSGFAIYPPSNSTLIDPARAMANHKGYVYAAVNAKAREVMNIDWRLFEDKGDSPKENTSHEVLDLLDSVNDNMTGLELKYNLSAHLDLAGNAYWFFDGVKDELTKPTAIHPMDPSKVRPLIDRRSWPYQLIGYKMKLENVEMTFQPYEVLHFRLPNPNNFFEGMSPTQAGAEYIDNDNYAMEFNRKFFRNGARPAGFLETDMIAANQTDSLLISFAGQHEGIDNMNRIGVLPKGVKWSPTGSSPKDMDFKNLSEDSKDRILAMFGVSRTILGTAESDTNRATAETADYVFAKRVIAPHMKLICSFLNEKLIPRYGDNLYISFIDPVPEDRAARTEEMKTAVGGQPVLTVEEAREEYMGLGPVDGGDILMRPTTMQPATTPASQPAPVPDNDDDDDASAGKTSEPTRMKLQKAANGARVAFRPLRTKLRKRAEQRKEMRLSLTERITAAVKKALEEPVAKFSTKEQDEAAWKEFSARTHAAEAEIAGEIRTLNAKQQEEVLGNLEAAIAKAIDPSKLFDLDNWISITTDAMTPIMESLFVDQGKAAALEIGKPDIDPLTETAKRVLHDSIAKMSKSYNETIRAALEKNINQGLAEGQSLADISKGVKEVYEGADDYGAERIAKTEAFRTANMSLKSTWQQSGVVKTIKWYTSEKGNVCPYCQAMDGKVISIESNFLDEGQTLSIGEGDDTQTMTADYGDVGAPPLHPNCSCFARPEDVSLD